MNDSIDIPNFIYLLIRNGWNVNSQDEGQVVFSKGEFSCILFHPLTIYSLIDMIQAYPPKEAP